MTLVGTITSDIRFGTAGEFPVARFRIRAQSRRFDKTTNTWQDGEPSYYSAVAWRHLAEHIASSLGVGDPVLAHGRLRMARWRPDADPTQWAELELVSIGHDLRWGTTVYRKAQPPPLMRRSAARGRWGLRPGLKSAPGPGLIRPPVLPALPTSRAPAIPPLAVLAGPVLRPMASHLRTQRLPSSRTPLHPRPPSHRKPARCPNPRPVTGGR